MWLQCVTCKSPCSDTEDHQWEDRSGRQSFEEVFRYIIDSEAQKQDLWSFAKSLCQCTFAIRAKAKTQTWGYHYCKALQIGSNSFCRPEVNSDKFVLQIRPLLGNSFRAPDISFGNFHKSSISGKAAQRCSHHTCNTSCYKIVAKALHRKSQCHWRHFVSRVKNPQATWSTVVQRLAKYHTWSIVSNSSNSILLCYETSQQGIPRLDLGTSCSV